MNQGWEVVSDFWEEKDSLNIIATPQILPFLSDHRIVHPGGRRESIMFEEKSVSHVSVMQKRSAFILSAQQLVDGEHLRILH